METGVVYSWRVRFIDTGGDKPVKEGIVLNVLEGNSVEDMFGQFIKIAYEGREDTIDAVKYEKIGRTFIPRG